MIPTDRLRIVRAAAPVWRVGRKPSPWDWPDWKYADGSTGTFSGRWDAPVPHTYRTTYAATRAEGALLEVLARFRPDPQLVADMDSIAIEETDTALYSTSPAGLVPEEWFEPRMLASATFAGSFCDIAHSETVAALWSEFQPRATAALGLSDFDGSALQNADVRPLTQAVGERLYRLTTTEGTPLIDGIRFLSRFGADQELWTVFEQPSDGVRSPLLTGIETVPLSPAFDPVQAAMTTLGLTTDSD